MRFNGKELTCLAYQSSDQFDKEGVLFVKERQEGLFRKGEGLRISLLHDLNQFICPIDLNRSI